MLLSLRAAKSPAVILRLIAVSELGSEPTILRLRGDEPDELAGRSSPRKQLGLFGCKGIVEKIRDR